MKMNPSINRRARFARLARGWLVSAFSLSRFPLLILRFPAFPLSAFNYL
jgi:hypothetical protein